MDAQTIIERGLLLKKYARQTGTDKLRHGYLDDYAEFLPMNCKKMLEIGIAEGKSAILWQKFYGEQLQLSYIDLFINPDFVSPAWAKERGIISYVGSQSDVALLNRVRDMFDVIIDDGSHSPGHQIISFMHLFIKNLNNGAVYFIEDMHCNTDPYFWDKENDIESFEDTCLWMFKNFKETGKLVNKLITLQQATLIESLIDSVEIRTEEKIVVITKKQNNQYVATT